MKRLEDRLVERGLLTPEALAEARQTAAERHEPLFPVLVRGGWVPEGALLREAAAHHGLSFVSLLETPVDPAAVRQVPAKLAAHYAVMPIRWHDGVLTIAVADPLEMAAVEDIQTNLRCQVERVLAARGEIAEALQRHYGVGAATVERILAESPDRESGEVLEESHDLGQGAEDASVVRLVNQLLQDAIADRATDIHFEAHRGGVVIRRRIDGVLHDTSVPRNIRLLYPAIVSRIKLMSRLNIVERRLPQDGRARVRLAGRDYDLRVSVVPAMHGEDVVIRILPSVMLFDLGDLGFSEEHLRQVEELIAQPHGILFVTGPTGSGKSTTLYACLSRLNERSRKIITIEDPVEYELPGITQTQVQPAIGLSFARSLSSMLRHDPDVMMIGEVRDRETAEIAVQTAMTGHLVLSTLHTNDAASGAVRLLDMGVDPYLVTSTVRAFIAQRLVRVICRQCREQVEGQDPARWRGRGCRVCGQTGYRGRVAIAEFMPLLPALQELVLQRASALQLRQAADRLGMKTLGQDGWDKVAEGVTTADEVRRVTSL